MKLATKLALFAVFMLAAACGGGGGPGPDNPSDTKDTVPDGAVNDIATDTADIGDANGDGGDAGETTGQCSNQSDCDQGYCLEFPPASGTNICAQPCFEECPEGFECRLGFPIGSTNPVSVCLPAMDIQCRVCNRDSECLFDGAVCLKGSAPFGFCVLLCSEEAPCGAGFNCETPPPQYFESQSRYCIPKAGSCCVAGGWADCDDDNPCSAESCHPSLGCQYKAQDGACEGENPCMEYSCVDMECLGFPLTEDLTFDGIDDDCDGTTDEDVWMGLGILHSNYGSGGKWATGGGMKLLSIVNSPGFHGTSKGGSVILRPGMPYNR